MLTIWNLGLARVGADADVSDPNEQSREAQLCRQFYPIARNSLLEMHDWNFATRRGSLALLSETDAGNFVYEAPADALRVFAIGPEQSMRTWRPSDDFEQETDAENRRLILTSTLDAWARYTVVITDVTNYSPLFKDALSWMLASYLAGPILKGKEGRAESRALLQEASRLVGIAATSDANQRRDTSYRKEHKAPWMESRGIDPREPGATVGVRAGIPDLYPAT